MKKILSSILCAALIACMMVTLAGCGTAGHYTLKEMSYGGITVSAEDAELDPDENYIDMNANGTAVLCMDGEETDMEWKDGEIWAEGEDDEKADFEINDGELIIEVEDMEMIFEKD